MAEEDLLIINNNKRVRYYDCLNTLYYIVYYIYHIIMFSMLSVNTYYTINLYEGVNEDTKTLNDGISDIREMINKLINRTFN